MDKRLSLALLLTALVVAVTPILFPTPRRATESPGQKPGDSAAITQAERPADTLPAVVDSSPRRAAIDSVPVAAVSAGEISRIETPRLVYEFSNIGAAPVGIEVQEYVRLAAGGGKVMLHQRTEPVLRYMLVLQRDTIDLANTAFHVSRSGNALTYSGDVAGGQVTLRYEILPERYVVQVSGNASGFNGPAFLLIRLPASLPASEADTTSDLRALSYSFKPTRDNARGVPFGKLDPGESRLEPGPIAWAAIRNKYFVVGLVNREGDAFEEILLEGGARTSRIATTASATVVKGLDRDGDFSFDMYSGPQQSTHLLAMGRDFDHVNPYGWSFLQPIVNPIAALTIRLLLWMHDTLKLSYGWVLVIFGVCIRIALWPLNQSAMRASLKMQELQPRLADVQKKYKDNPAKQREEMMRVYKEAGASPFTALSGCLPMLIPMPVLFALFFVFQNTIEFRGVSFLWLPDISVKDPLYVLPVLMGASMYVLSWIGLRNAPPNPQAKMMSYMFPVMMTFVLLNMASGLNLYYTSQNIAALPQQWLLARERLKMRAKKS